MSRLYNLARMHVATLGSVALIDLGNAVTGFLTFALAGVTDGTTVSYAINDPRGGGSEIGSGVYHSSGPSFTRTAVESSTNGGGRISLSVNAEVMIAPASTELNRLYLTIGTDISAWDADLDAIAALSGTGLSARTTTDTWALRSLAAPAAGITITNPAGVAGNPTLVLANDLAAVEGLASNGLAVRTATDTWAVRTLTGPAAGITVSNGDGISGNPTLTLANDLAALEALSSSGFAERTGTDTWTSTGFTGTGNVVRTSSPTITTPNVVGTATNNDASAGSVGEFVSSTILVGSAVALTTVTPANITSISLTAGDWDVWINARYTGGATTTLLALVSSISTTSATLDATPGRIFSSFHNGQAPFATTNLDGVVGAARLSLSGTTTVYFVAQANFAISTCSGFGIIQARRRR